MRRVVVLGLFAALSFVPGLFFARFHHEIRAFAAPDGAFHWSGRVAPVSGSGPDARLEVALHVERGEFDVSLGGPVDPGSLRLLASWRRRAYDAEGTPRDVLTGSLLGAATRLHFDERGGRISGVSPAVGMAKGPTVYKGGCGDGFDGQARHEIAFARDGRAYEVVVAIDFTKRGNRLVTIDADEE